jgi:RNA polymerase sigma-70 factor (ECF subfamily)
MDTVEAQQIEEARRGNLGAATQLVDRFYGRIYAFLRRLAASDADAADLTQRTFTRVWKSLGRFEGRSTFSSWLHGIAYHVFLDWQRSNHRQVDRSEAWWESCRDPGPAPDTMAEDADLAAALYGAVDRLEPGTRDSVHLHYYQGLTIEQTADVLGIATSTVKYRLRGAIEQLRSALKPRTAMARNVSPFRKL